MKLISCYVAFVSEPCCTTNSRFEMRPWLQVETFGALAGFLETIFNTALSSAREMIEWSNKDLSIILPLKTFFVC